MIGLGFGAVPARRASLVQPARRWWRLERRALARVLLIDDDERLNALLTEYLGKFGYSVRAATRPSAGFARSSRIRPIWSSST